MNLKKSDLHLLWEQLALLEPTVFYKVRLEKVEKIEAVQRRAWKDIKE